MSKKGLSPIIATVLLISIALILALIIFLWAKSFISEKTQKFNQPIEDACAKVSFDAEGTLTDGTLDVSVVNRGNVPLYGMQIKKKSEGTIINVGLFPGTIGNGEDGKVSGTTSDVASGDSVEYVPILVGEAGNSKKSYVCDGYGVEGTIV